MSILNQIKSLQKELDQLNRDFIKSRQPKNIITFSHIDIKQSELDSLLNDSTVIL